MTVPAAAVRETAKVAACAATELAVAVPRELAEHARAVVKDAGVAAWHAAMAPVDGRVAAVAARTRALPILPSTCERVSDQRVAATV